MPANLRFLESSNMADSSDLLTISDPIHIVLVKVDSSEERHLLSSYFMEWRQILCTENAKKTVFVELYGVGKLFLWTDSV